MFFNIHNIYVFFRNLQDILYLKYSFHLLNILLLLPSRRHSLQFLHLLPDPRGLLIGQLLRLFERR